MTQIIKACIFDLDGVIVDTDKYHFRAWKLLADQLEIDFTEKDNELLKGVSRERSLEIILNLGNKTIADDLKIQLIGEKNVRYLEEISNMSPKNILPGVKELILTLKDKNIKLGIGSASKNTMFILNGIGLTDYFDTIVDGNKVNKAKPDPEVFLKCAKELGVKAQECVVFEDSQAGIDAANISNMYSVGVSRDKILNDTDFMTTSLENLDLELLNLEVAPV